MRPCWRSCTESAIDGGLGPDAAHEAMRDLVRPGRRRVASPARRASICRASCSAWPDHPGRKGGRTPIGAGSRRSASNTPPSRYRAAGLHPAVTDAEGRSERLTCRSRSAAWLGLNRSSRRAGDAGVAFIVAVDGGGRGRRFQRSRHPRQLMAYLGLTPSEHSSGPIVRRGGINQAGSSLARRALVEGAWATGCRPASAGSFLDRMSGLPQIVRDIAWNGQLRMCQRYRHLMAAGKPRVVAVTAIAREMAGFIWAIAAPWRLLTPDAAETPRERFDLPMRSRGGTRWEPRARYSRRRRRSSLIARQPQDETHGHAVTNRA